MKKHKCFYILAGLIGIMTVISLISNFSYVFVKPKDSDLQSYLELNPENNYYYDSECIPNAKTAAKIGGVIIDNMCNKGAFSIGFITVEYDAANRLWRVNKGYLFSQGGFVVIKQDTGEIVRALLNK